MMMRFLISLLIVLYYGCYGCGPTKEFFKLNSLISAPNIVLIVIDDIGYNDLGIYGSTEHNTPNINNLAREGILFTDFHTNGAVCSPTRAALMTGQYQQRSDVEHAIGFNMEEGMPLEKQTIAEILGEAGYKCGVFGKWHLGHVSRFGPNYQGFEHSVVSNNTPDYHTHISREGLLDWFLNHQLLVDTGYLTDLVTNYSIRFIEENRNNPFFLYISHIAAHFPFQGPDDPPHRTLNKVWHESKYGPLPESEYKRAYKDMIERVDKSIGTVIEYLEIMDLRKNSLIFITSDNGAYSWIGSNFPFRGQKGDLFEGGHRVPAIANWPDKITGNTISDATIMTMDLAPTFVSLANVEFQKNKNVFFDGMDISPILFGKEDLEERILYWQFTNPYTNTFSYSVRRSNWKYIVKDEEKYLFNLDTDQSEQKNLVARYPNKVDMMESDFKKWQTRINKKN